MSDLWSKVKKIFTQAAESSAQQPVIHELIQRDHTTLAFQEKFIHGLVHRRFNDWLHDQFAIYLSTPENLDEAIDFISTPSIKGFVVHFRMTQYDIKEIIALFDHFKNQILTIGYHSYVSDVKGYNRGQWSEELQRHYLKPSLRVQEIEQQQINQQFGNINIELLTRNAKVWHLKFSATVYNDRMYQEGDDFEKLLRLVGS